MEGDPVDWLVGATIEQGKRRRAQSDQLTYHGVDVPVWEDRVLDGGAGPPPGDGWAIEECMGSDTLWRRPHPWRVMLEAAGHPAPRREEPAP